MSDKPMGTAGSGARTPGSTGDELQRAGQDLRAAASEAKATAGDAARQVQADASDVAREAMDRGREVAGAARERAVAFAEEQKAAGAEGADSVARAIHRAADELQGASPMVAGYVRDGAEYVGRLSTALRDRSVGDLVSGIGDFARQQPVAFFGAAVLAGFAISRFAKSSAQGSAPRYGMPASSYYGGNPYTTIGGGEEDYAPRGMTTSAGEARTTGTGAPGWVPNDDATRASRPATMAAASLGGAAAKREGGMDAGSVGSSRPSGGGPAFTPAMPGTATSPLGGSGTSSVPGGSQGPSSGTAG